MDEGKRSAWSRSLLLRVVTYSISVSVALAGVAAWIGRDTLASGRFDYFAGLALIVGITSLLSYYLFGGALWLYHALIEQFSPSSRKDQP